MDSASITLTPTQATLGFAYSSAATSRSISLDCNLEQGTDVYLPTERTLKGAKWMVYVEEGVTYNDHAIKQDAIGFLKYWPGYQSADDHPPEACHVSFALKPEIFSTLLSSLQKGYLPKTVHIEVKGLEWGQEPDGSGVMWNVEAANALPIVEAKFFVPLSG